MIYLILPSSVCIFKMNPEQTVKHVYVQQYKHQNNATDVVRNFGKDYIKNTTFQNKIFSSIYFYNYYNLCGDTFSRRQNQNGRYIYSFNYTLVNETIETK